jgi:hypothetical protein
MHPRMRMVLGLVGILALVAIGLPALWHQPDSSGSAGLHEAMAGDDPIKGAAQEMLDAAKQYEQEAERHEADAQRYEQKAAAVTPLMDTKGFLRDALKTAAASHRAMANQLRFHANTYRIEAELMMERGKHTDKAKK